VSLPPREIGRYSYIGGQGEISADVRIGHFTSIAPYVQMHGRIQHPCIAHPELVSSGSGRAIPGYPRSIERNDITIGSDVWIGRNAVLLGGVNVGHGAIIGAYTVVAKDVPPYAVVVGNPAVVIRYRFDQTTITRLLSIRWWEWSDELIRQRAADLCDVRSLLAAWG
jgi:acetyltransferase-like isoleucine patch superfamily enzyme